LQNFSYRLKDLFHYYTDSAFYYIERKEKINISFIEKQLKHLANTYK